MFYYISFLRPPPLKLLPSSPIVITPQIANDLRTELFEGSHDIYFSWSPATDNQSAETSNFNCTKPAKLTTWRQSNAYKELTVPSPPSVRDGQSWRLILCSEQRISIGLEEDHGTPRTGLGHAPFPVISMPIVFTKNAGKDRGKQEKIERHYRFTVKRHDSSERANVSLRITEQTSFDLDKKIWDSGIGLSSWLAYLANDTDNEDELLPSVQALKHTLFDSRSRKIVELGAGTGIVALTLGALRSGLISSSEAVEQEDGCIVTTDLPSAMPLLEHNIIVNSHLFAQPSVRPRPEVLDWDAVLPQYPVAFSPLDAILMADVTYNTASFPSLMRTLTSLIALNPSDKPPIILLGYKERDAAERSLWQMAAEAGVHFERVGERLGAGGAPIEIWIGRVQNVER